MCGIWTFKRLPTFDRLSDTASRWIETPLHEAGTWGCYQEDKCCVYAMLKLIIAGVLVEKLKQV